MSEIDKLIDSTADGHTGTSTCRRSCVSDPIPHASQAAIVANTVVGTIVHTTYNTGRRLVSNFTRTADSGCTIRLIFRRQA